jgi:hypothetical protein
MHKLHRFLLIAICSLTIFCPHEGLSQTETAEVQKGIRQMADAIVRDLHNDGPIAWLGYFSHSDRFFMASDGQLVFPNIDTADVFVKQFAKKIRQVDLTWNEIRVDSLAPGLGILAASFQEIQIGLAGVQDTPAGYFTGIAEYTQQGWKLRDAHWSVLRSRR